MSQKPDELLNLPRISGIKRRKQVLSMDEYDQFNLEGAATMLDREAYLKEKRRREVRKMFVLER